MTQAFLYVQHLLGTGHIRRAACLASALLAKGVAVTVAHGGFPHQGVDFGAADLAYLPPVRAADATFSALLDERGHPIDESWKTVRRQRLLSLFVDTRPDLLLIEFFPFGRRQFRFELLPLLELAHVTRPRPLIASSVRDILVAKTDPRKYDDMARIARSWFDLVLIHGDPAIVPFEATFPPAPILADLMHYTGYVAAKGDTGAPPGDEGHEEVIVSVGGGAVGFALLKAAVEARPISAASNRTWRLLLGSDLRADDVAAIRAAAGNQGPGLIIEPARRDFPALLERCLVSISQAGYNTVMDILKAGCRAIVVPFAAGAETEQAERAARLADRGVLSVIDEGRLTPHALAEAVDRAVARPPPDPNRLRIPTDGAARSAEILVDHIARSAGERTKR